MNAFQLFEYPDQPPEGREYDFGPKARADDPPTAKEAARTVLKTKAGSQRQRLWEVFRYWAPDTGLTDEQAAKIANIPLTSEYATRCSELRNAGLIEPTGESRAGSSGMQREVSRITDLGTSEYDRLFAD